MTPSYYRSLAGLQLIKDDLGGGNSNICYFHPYLGKIPILTNIFQRGWNHQLVILVGERNPAKQFIEVAWTS